jgi:hypothetical protein
MRAIAAALALLVLIDINGGGRGRAQAPRPDPVVQTLRDLETALSADRPDGLAALTSPQLPPAQTALLNEIRMDDHPARPHAIVRERERRPAGDGFLVVADLLVSRGAAGRLATWEIDVRPRAPSADRLTIAGIRQVAHLDDLIRLSLDTTRQFSVHNLVFAAPDFVLTMPAGTAFTASGDFGVTALVLRGRGEVHFTPPDRAEQDQLRLFSRHPSIDSTVDDVYIRVNPADLGSHFSESALAPTALRPAAAAQAQEIFDRFSSKSFTLNLGDLSPPSSGRWSILPAVGSVAVELKSPRYGWLTYARSINDPEDVNLFDRAHVHNLSLYASSDRIAERGRFYDEDAGAAYDVIEYGLDVAFDPSRAWIGGHGRVRIRVLSDGLESVSFRLAESLAVSSVTSPDLGRLLAMRVLGQTTVLVSLPRPVDRNQEITFDLAYSGRLDPQELGDETLSVQAQNPQVMEGPELLQKPEPRFMYSSRVYWYPQGMTTDYAPAAMRLTVPADYQVVASGTQIRSVTAQGVIHGESKSVRTVEFFADRPVRYLACEISRFVSLGRTTIQVPVADAPDPSRQAASGTQTTELALDVLATPRLVGSNRGVAARTEALVKFFANLLGDAPYPSLTITVADALLPGGHSPAYFALVQQPLPSTPYAWREDPLNLDRFPDFLLGHEVAHQWWGQAVGFKNYHDQWLSEGLAQYSAAMFIDSTRPDLFRSLLTRMRDSAESFSSKGPIYLGYRLGHIEGRSATFRAIAYNKSAVVLHMLRRLIGDEAFRSGLRRFYREWRFKKAGTDDLRAAFEAEARRPLGRFFDRWILGSTLPHVRVTTQAGREPGFATVRVEQVGEVFDFPLTVTVQYTDGTVEEQTLLVTEAVHDHRIPLAGPVRRILTRDELTLAQWVD